MKCVIEKLINIVDHIKFVVENEFLKIEIKQGL